MSRWGFATGRSRSTSDEGACGVDSFFGASSPGWSAGAVRGVTRTGAMTGLLSGVVVPGGAGSPGVALSVPFERHIKKAREGRAGTSRDRAAHRAETRPLRATPEMLRNSYWTEPVSGISGVTLHPPARVAVADTHHFLDHCAGGVISQPAYTSIARRQKWRKSATRQRRTYIQHRTRSRPYSSGAVRIRLTP